MAGGTTRTSHQERIAAFVPEGLAKPASVPVEIFDAALGIFLAGRRLDMRALAQQLGIGRATLYRKVGDRDRLLGEVLWWLTRHAIWRAIDTAGRRRGRSRVLMVIDHLLRDINGQPALRRLLDAEPEAALRILTSKHGRVQAGLVEALEQLLRGEARAGLELGMDAQTLAYTIVRIGEGFLYADVIADSEPDIDEAMVVIKRLLGGR
jgi:AcrR family transcriptional regulator